MERKGIFKLPYQILIYDIPKYLQLTDFINYTSTCKYLNDNFIYSDIWKKVLKDKFTEEEQKFAENEKTAYDKYKLLSTQTINYKKCDIAHRDTCWTERDDCMNLNSVCWFHIIGKLDNVPDGRYVPEFRIKIKRRPLGLDRLEFIAKVIEMEIDSTENKQEEQGNVEENQDPEEETQHRDGEDSNDENENTTVSQTNNSNNETSFFGLAFRALTLNRIRRFNNSRTKSTNDTNNEQKKELFTRVICETENKFNRSTLNIYKNAEWRSVECPEIVVDRSKIDQRKSRLRVELQIKDLNGYWKNGISFKGMRLRKVISSDDSSSDMAIDLNNEQIDIYV